MMSSLVYMENLTQARLQLHYAIQFVAIAGEGLLAPTPDNSQSSLMWHVDRQCLIGQSISAPQPFRVALDPRRLVLQLWNSTDGAIATFSLHEQTLETGLVWLKAQVEARGADPERLRWIDYPSDFPDAEFARGAAFDAYRCLTERNLLVDYYSQTHMWLMALQMTQLLRTLEVSPIHIWPHHFDMACLISLGDGERSIGVGFSPGDGSYDEPYWYVSPWPYPPAEKLPSLDGCGVWHTQDWVGAILTAAHLESDRQGLAFLAAATRESYALLQEVTP
jgi:hypothetical protein